MILEDDIYLREELQLTFQRKGYMVSCISSFAAPEDDILSAAPDLVLLDINLPGKSGFMLCKWIKSHTDLPVLILTSRDAMADELHALGLGADDYLTKPCHPDRLLARTEHLLQTYGRLKHLIQTGSLALDTDTYQLIREKTSLILPETEGKILKLLMEHCPDIVPKQEILTSLWGTDEYINENILQVNITRLRKRLSEAGFPDIIQSARGQGYYLEIPSPLQKGTYHEP